MLLEYESCIRKIGKDYMSITSDRNLRVNELKSEVNGLKSEVNGLKSEVNGIKSDVGGIKSDVDGLKSDVNGIKSDVSGIKSDVDDIKQKIDSLYLAEERKKDVRKHPLVRFTSGFVGVCAAGFISWISLNIISLNTNVEIMSEQISTLNTEMNELHDLENKYHDLDKSNAVIQDRLEISSIKEQEVYEIADVENLDVPFVGSTYEEAISPDWTDTSSVEIKTDTNGNETCEAGSLVGKKLLIPYKNGNQEVIFYGQINEYYHWNEDCLLNVYENGELYLTMIAKYDDGQLLSYKQVFRDTKDSEKVWIVSNRKSQKNVNTGETWVYKRNNEQQQDFELVDVTFQDLHGVNEIIVTLCGNKISYYNGYTSDGFYNDSSGNAYYVGYDDEEKIRTLYVGRFKNGEFEDNTGNAWEIARDPKKDTDYMYFIGYFEKNTKNENKKHYSEYPISQERINELTKGIVFNCEMNWFVREARSEE